MHWLWIYIAIYSPSKASNFRNKMFEKTSWMLRGFFLEKKKIIVMTLGGIIWELYLYFLCLNDFILTQLESPQGSNGVIFCELWGPKDTSRNSHINISSSSQFPLKSITFK